MFQDNLSWNFKHTYNWLLFLVSITQVNNYLDFKKVSPVTSVKHGINHWADFTSADVILLNQLILFFYLFFKVIYQQQCCKKKNLSSHYKQNSNIFFSMTFFKNKAWNTIQEICHTGILPLIRMPVFRWIKVTQQLSVSLRFCNNSVSQINLKFHSIL